MARAAQPARRYLSLLALSGLLACGAGAETPPVAGGAASEEFFPLVEGASWTYSLVFRGVPAGEIEVKARGSKAVSGLGSPLFIMDEVAPLGRAAGFAEVAPVGYVRDGEYVLRYVGIDYDGDGIRLLGGEDPVRVLPLDPARITAWEEESTLFELPEGRGGGTRRWTYSLSVLPELEVPAGTFRDVIRVESELFEEDFSADQPSRRFHDFYARGVGLIRTISYDMQAEERVDGEQSLLRYVFPAS